MNYKECFVTVRHALWIMRRIDKVVNTYHEMNKEWIRCKDIDPYNYQSIAVILNKLAKHGYAIKRTILDGTKPHPHLKDRVIPLTHVEYRLLI